MKRLAILAPLALLALTPLAGHALTISPSTSVCGADTCLLTTGNQTSQAAINVAIADLLGDSVEIYKQNVGGSESGLFAASYTTTFLNTPLDPKDATIEYVTGMPAIAEATHLLVKDGNHSPAWYLFKLSWDGLETLTLNDFWPGNGAISHVTLYGGRGQTSVPEPATLALLGAGLLPLLRRRRKAA